MQIICNNCGNDLKFSNRQVYVTCSHCYTNLQIETDDNRIFATIVEEREIDNSIFQHTTSLIPTEYPNELYDLIHLDDEYEEVLEETTFYSITQGKKNRPMFLRAFYRMLISVSMILMVLGNINDFGGVPSDYRFWIIVILISFYWFIMTKGGIQELRKAWELRQFEKNYFKEKKQLFTTLKDDDLPQNLQYSINTLEDNHDAAVQIIKEFHYIKFFKSVRINVGFPSISKGLRIFGLAIPIGLVALAIGFGGYAWAFLFVGLAIIAVFFGFIIMGDTNEYKRVSQQNFTERMAIIDKIKKLIR